VKSNNIDGIKSQQVSSLMEMEPLIIQWCKWMAGIGMALTRENFVALVMDLIQGTKCAKDLVAFKKKRKLVTKDGETVIVGVRWYKSFMRRNKEALRRARCKEKDQKRQTWCTYKNFASMYKNVHDSMVEAKVAKK
jgi:hypothetical protein